MICPSSKQNPIIAVSLLAIMNNSLGEHLSTDQAFMTAIKQKIMIILDGGYGLSYSRIIFVNFYDRRVVFLDLPNL